MPAVCPCGSGRTYKDCCGRFLSGEAYPQTPEQLMRSRYSAFALGFSHWIRDTWAPEKRPQDCACDMRLRWLGLKVLSSSLQDPIHATVEFIARARVGGAGALRLHEKSRFEKRDGKWLYVDGDEIPGDKK